MMRKTAFFLFFLSSTVSAAATSRSTSTLLLDRSDFLFKNNNNNNGGQDDETITTCTTNQELINNVSTTECTLAAGDVTAYTIPYVVEDGLTIECSIDHPTSDIRLYMSASSSSIDQADCIDRTDDLVTLAVCDISTSATTNETAYVWVQAIDAAANYSLTCAYAPCQNQDLTLEAPIGNCGPNAVDQVDYYRLTGTSTFTSYQCEATTTTNSTLRIYMAIDTDFDDILDGVDNNCVAENDPEDGRLSRTCNMDTVQDADDVDIYIEALEAGSYTLVCSTV